MQKTKSHLAMMNYKVRDREGQRLSGDGQSSRMKELRDPEQEFGCSEQWGTVG